MSKQQQIKAVRGMNDLLPPESALWARIEGICDELLGQYSYRRINTPVVESTALFARSIGDETDIVAKEMYSFEDRNGDSLTLRPEGTASCVRAGIEHGLFYNQQQRLWYRGPMYRHERPQKGRYREFFQLGAEAFGWTGPDIEAELIGLTDQLFKRLGLEQTELQINCLGDAAARQNYRAALVGYLQSFADQLDDDSKRRLDSNPLRILDSKNPDTQALLVGAPDILDFLSDTSKQHFEQLQQYLAELGIEFTINPCLVRGLDYYNDTVFEWINPDFGAQATVCGGGRYDHMVEQLGGPPTACFGFALGMERLVQMLQEQAADISQIIDNPDIFIVSIGNSARANALLLQQSLCREGVRVQLHCGAGSMKNQFKKADASGASLVLVIGEQEVEDGTVALRSLRQREEQQIIAQNEAVIAVTNRLESL
ncbi:MAG: histidine--tRNA ligase [Gammaproteobacteria bacterium]|nr:histidine--tRNA ligase [Gammaproteobacteria bacterium]